MQPYPHLAFPGPFSMPSHPDTDAACCLLVTGPTFSSPPHLSVTTPTRRCHLSWAPPTLHGFLTGQGASPPWSDGVLECLRACSSPFSPQAKTKARGLQTQVWASQTAPAVSALQLEAHLLSLGREEMRRVCIRLPCEGPPVL